MFPLGGNWMKDPEDVAHTLESPHGKDIPVTIRPDSPDNGINPPGQPDSDPHHQDAQVPPPANKNLTFSSTSALRGSSSEKEGFHILGALCSMPGIEYGGIYAVDPITQDIRLILYRFLEPGFLSMAYLLPHDSANARIVRQGYPYYMAFEAPAPDNGSFYDIMRRQGHKNIVCIPMMLDGEAVGALNLASLTLPSFPPDLRHHLESVAEKLGPLVNRIRLERPHEARLSESCFDAVEEEVYVVDEDDRILHANHPAHQHMPELHALISRRDAVFLQNPNGTFRITTASGDGPCRQDIQCPNTAKGEWQGFRVHYRAGTPDAQIPDPSY